MEKAVARGLPVQLSHSVDTQVSISDTARSFGEVRRRTYEGYLRVEALRDRGTGSDGRPRASGGQRSSRVSISDLMGILKGKTAIGIFKHFPNLRRKPYWGNHFWSRGYCVSTIGLDEEKIRRYVRYQEDNERLEEKEREEAGLFRGRAKATASGGGSLLGRSPA